MDVKVTQAGNHSEQLAPAVERLARRMGRNQRQRLADGDYSNHRSIEAMPELGVDCVGRSAQGGDEKDCTGTGRFTSEVFVYDPEVCDPEQDHYVCPGDKRLRYEGRQTQSGEHFLPL